MKRSEAVGQMAGYLSTFSWYSSYNPNELVELSKHIINGAEKIGMIPPVWLEATHPKDSPDGSNIVGNYVNYTWENEDEKN